MLGIYLITHCTYEHKKVIINHFIVVGCDGNSCDLHTYNQRCNFSFRYDHNLIITDLSNYSAIITK